MLAWVLSGLLHSKLPFQSVLSPVVLYIFNTLKSSCITSSQLFHCLPPPPMSYYNIPTLLCPFFQHVQTTLVYYFSAVSYAYQSHVIFGILHSLLLISGLCHISCLRKSNDIISQLSKSNGYFAKIRLCEKFMNPKI